MNNSVIATPKYVWNNLGYESTFATAYVMKSKYRPSFSNENVVSELRCARSINYTLDFKNLVQKRKISY